MTGYEAANLAEQVKIQPYDHIHQKNFVKWLEQEYKNVKIIKEPSFQELYHKHMEN